MPTKLNVMISSTARDLPAHRQEVMDACLRQGMFPTMMEHLPASDAEAIGASLQMVDDADIYIGIFAHRYGYVPKGHALSVTEMEYNRAVERKIPRLIFVMDKSHPVTIDDIEMGEGAAKLKTFKERVQTDNIVNFFTSPADLRGLVINSLSRHRESDLTAFHYVSDIPQPPETYIAHPYTLLQTHGLVGRQAELNLLTDWVTRPEFKDVRIFNVVAIGGMGKSALTWHWFNAIASQELKPLAGRLWWSFYESDASFENFVIRALAYVTRRSREEVQKITSPEREEQLLAALGREPFLLVLDGLERILIAYARMDAARLADDDLDQQTANRVAQAYGLPESAGQSFVGQHQLRKTTDPRAGIFLRKLSQVHASRILVSTRLYPADLQMWGGEPMPSCFALFLPGLSDDDALNLWRAFGVSGSRETLLPLFRTFGQHPLLLQALASVVANHRRTPGDFDRWRQAHPTFNPFALPLVQARTHVLEFALAGLDDQARQMLQTIAAFRMPASYDTLAALFVGRLELEPDEEDTESAEEKDASPEAQPEKLFPTELGLDNALKDLEDRGLVGWDKRANRYDLHPIVRGVVWNTLSTEARVRVFTSLQMYFVAVPKVDNYLQVNSLEDLTPAIELYNTLIGLGRYDDAWKIFRSHLDKATDKRLSVTRERILLLNLLFQNIQNYPPRLPNNLEHAWALHSLAESYLNSGQPGQCAFLCKNVLNLIRQEQDIRLYHAVLIDLADSSWRSGEIRLAEQISRQSILIGKGIGSHFWEAVSLGYLGRILSVRNESRNAEIVLNRSLEMFVAQHRSRSQGVSNALLANLFLWCKKHTVALQLADRAWELAQILKHERDFIRTARLQGMAALNLDFFTKADERLHYTLSRARTVELLEEELPALVGLAELQRRQGNPQVARELLAEVWEATERGPFPLFHADAFNVLAQIERDVGNAAAAIEAATQAYRSAWCDGPPFAYHWGLVAARQHLAALGAPEPSLPPFDESKYEPMPEVEINPEDEFHGG